MEDPIQWVSWYFELSELKFSVFDLLIFQQRELEDLKRSSEEFRREYHRLQILVKEHEAEIQHREQETRQLNEALVEAKNMYTVAQQHVSSLKHEKEELEELLGTRNGMLNFIALLT